MNSFIKTFFISSILFLTLFVGLIWSIDPYNKLGNNLFGFETKAVAQSRENKFYQLESSKKKYNAFILGSSSAHRYPTQKLNELTGLLTYNYAVQHSTPIDYLAQVKHILSKYNPKLILLQIDFAGLDAKYKVDNRLFNSPLTKFLREKKQVKKIFDNNSFTLDALRDSFRVIFVNTFGKARHIYLENGDYIYSKPKKQPVRIKQGNNLDYTFDYDRLRILLDIQKICIKNNIQLITFAAPVSHGHYAKIQNTPHLKRMYHKYLSELSSNLKDFVDTKELNSRKYDSFHYFHDSVHPSKEMSEIILDYIFRK